VSVYIVGDRKNPRGPDTGEALDPRVPGSGRRLFEISGMSLDDYLAWFERVNAADDPKIPDGSVVVLLGVEASRWFLGYSYRLYPLYTFFYHRKCWAVRIPHPSGRSLVYNAPEQLELASKTLERALLIERSKDSVSSRVRF
jgi:hypothetical protein